MPFKVFFSYAHKDEKLLDSLREHLAPLKNQGLIQSWHDKEITAGTEWEPEIVKQLEGADIILLLISAAFMNSEYCYGKELRQAISRHESGEARVIPIILRPVDWENTQFGKLQALPSNGKPVTDRSWQSRDRAFLSIVKGIQQVIKEIIVSGDGDTQAESPNRIVLSTAAYITTKKHILIVDDAASVGSLLKTVVEALGNNYYVTLLEDGREALIFLERIHVDLLLIDINMSRIGGFEVIEQLRKAGNAIPIVAMSADSRYEIEALRLGANKFVSKPTNGNRIRAMIEESLNGK